MKAEAWPRHVQSRRKLGALAALAVAVAAVHLWFVDQHMPARLGDGAAEVPLRRIDVAFVRELAPAQPSAVCAAAQRRLPRLAAAPAQAASSPAIARDVALDVAPDVAPVASAESLPPLPELAALA